MAGEGEWRVAGAGRTAMLFCLDYPSKPARGMYVRGEPAVARSNALLGGGGPCGSIGRVCHARRQWLFGRNVMFIF